MGILMEDLALRLRLEIGNLTLGLILGKGRLNYYLVTAKLNWFYND